MILRDHKKIFLDSREAAEDFLVNNKSYIYREMNSSIEWCLKNKINSCIVLELLIPHSSPMPISINKEEFEVQLKKAIEWFESIEAYEECARIMKIKDLLYKK